MHNKYMINNKYYPTIGIECHVQLKTQTKLFAGVENDARNAEPNTLISPLCVGLPGTLPVLNYAVIPLSIRAGLALNAQIANISHFDRKHYFYPDLPLGYQITQYERPIIYNGSVKALLPNGDSILVGIERAHLEADAGKSLHPDGSDYSLVDLNRAGTPLLEIVSGPDMHSAQEARAYAYELYLLMKYSGVSDVDLYHGNMRFDVNVSVSKDLKKLGTRSETKNLNSFKSVEKTVEYEIKRQIDLLERGKAIVQETRGWDDAKQKTFSQRSKEDAHDYRYFPDPDIPPITISVEQIASEKKLMPLLPNELRKQFKNIGLDANGIATLIDDPKLSGIILYILESHDLKTARTIANWCLGVLTRYVNEETLTWQKVSESIPYLVELASMVDSGRVSNTVAKELILKSIIEEKSPLELAKELNLLQVSDESELVMLVEQVLSQNEKAVADVKAGQTKVIGFLVGQIMKASKGRANPASVQKIIKEQLGV